MSPQVTDLPAKDQQNKFNTVLEISRWLMSLKQETRSDAILKKLQPVINYDSAVLALFRGEAPVEYSVRGALAEMPVLNETGLLANLNPAQITRREPCLVKDIWGDTPQAQWFWQIIDQLPASDPTPSAQARLKEAFSVYHAFLGIPLVVEQTVTGLVGLLHYQTGYYVAEHASIGMAFGYQVAIALANEQLYHRAQNLAILEERDRLARELHDNLAQTLGYLNLQLTAAGQQLNEGKIEPVQKLLQELKQLVGETYTDVREEIFNLRSAKEMNQSFLDSLREYIAKYKLHYKLDIALLIPANNANLQFAPEVGSQVMRIIQEALINVRKHTTETSVTIRLNMVDDSIRISVEDKGAGFDPVGVKPSGNKGLGLQIMRERAESIGGKLQVESVPNDGTKIIMVVPAAKAN